MDKIPSGKVKFSLSSAMIDSVFRIYNQNGRFSFIPFEQDLIEWASQFLIPGKSFVDIGAHIGTYALQYAALGIDVHAFEPQSDTFKLLSCGVEMNGLSDKVSSYRSALSYFNGIDDLRIVSVDGGGSSIINLPINSDPLCEKEIVEVRTLDSYELSNIGFIKIDAEGAECDALLGARQTLIHNDLPKIMLESWSRFEDKRSQLFALLDEFGYKICPISHYDEMFLCERK